MDLTIIVEGIMIVYANMIVDSRKIVDCSLITYINIVVNDNWIKVVRIIIANGGMIMNSGISSI